MSTGTDHPPPSTILCDFDGTLAFYDGFQGADHLGAPIPRMVERVREWIRQGREVVIFTSRLSWGAPTSEVPFETTRATAAHQRKLIKAWLREHIGCELPITNVKPYSACEIWDDRAIQVILNTGMTLREALEQQKVQRPPKCFRPPATLRRAS